MNIPRTKFADTNGVWRQFWHMTTELIEVFIELLIATVAKWFGAKDYLRYRLAGREAVDLQISAQTFRWILQKQYAISMTNCENFVYRKGIERGYYQRKDVFSVKEGWMGVGKPDYLNCDFEVLMDNGTIRSCRFQPNFDYGDNLFYTDCTHPMQNMLVDRNNIDQWRIKAPNLPQE